MADAQMAGRLVAGGIDVSDPAHVADTVAGQADDGGAGVWGGWSATALSTTATAPFRFTPRSTPAGARWWAKPPRATPARSLWPSSPTWSSASRAARRF